MSFNDSQTEFVRLLSFFSWLIWNWLFVTIYQDDLISAVQRRAELPGEGSGNNSKEVPGEQCSQTPNPSPKGGGLFCSCLNWLMTLNETPRCTIADIFSQHKKKCNAQKFWSFCAAAKQENYFMINLSKPLLAPCNTFSGHLTLHHIFVLLN